MVDKKKSFAILTVEFKQQSLEIKERKHEHLRNQTFGYRKKMVCR